MPKKRVFQLAKEMGLQSQALIAALDRLGVKDMTPASAIDEDTAKTLQELLAEQVAKLKAAEAEAAKAAEAAAKPAAEAPADAKKRGRPAQKPAEAAAPTPEAAPPAGTPAAEHEKREKEAEPERVLPRRASYFDQEMLRLERQLGLLAQEVDKETRPEAEKTSIRDVVTRPEGDRTTTGVEVPPVVTVLGHVDHGKTTLLDFIRKTNVTGGEEGGITQHIGASEVEHNGKSIVFLDTPGHEAFTQLRARGAQVTDIAVLVVAANDGVMPQTVEALNHAKVAKVPIIVAVNKVDLPDANPEKVKQQLLEFGLVSEEWGGDTIFVEVSALRGDGVADLLDMILLVAELREIWADPEGDFAGVIIEAQLDTSRGPITTILTRNGTLKIGDILICGSAYGKVRQIRDWLGRSVKEIGPGRPVEVVAFNEVPEPGALVERVKNVKDARRQAELRSDEVAIVDRQRMARRRVEGAYAELTDGQLKVLRAVIKADVWGSAEALRDAILRLAAGSEELEVNVIHLGVGDVTESDISLAQATEATVIAFRVGVSQAAKQMAADEHVQIRSYEIIYDALEHIRLELEGMLASIYREDRIGRAQVVQVFRARGFGAVAGCRILEGKLQSGAQVVVTRGRETVYKGTLDSLKHFDRNVDSLDAPNECGVGVRNWDNWQSGDMIEASLVTEIRPTLRPAEADTRA